MSLVGTRPILQDELRQYELHHRARIAIKPGITGMWQVSGRSDIIHWKKRRGSWMIVKTKISLSYAGMMSVIPCVPENLLMHHQCYTIKETSRKWIRQLE